MAVGVIDEAGLGFLPDGLVGYWTFDNDSAITCFDVSGKNNHGSFKNGAFSSSTSLVYGKALQLDSIKGVVKMYVESPSNTVLDFTTSTGFSISAWVKKVNNVEGAIVSKILDGTYAGYMLWYPEAPGNSVHLYINGGVRATITVVTNVWSHIVGTWNGTTPILYLNGILTNTGASYTTAPNSSGKVFQIGTYAAGTYGAINGYIDEVMIFNCALSQAEITQLYERGAAMLRG